MFPLYHHCITIAGFAEDIFPMGNPWKSITQRIYSEYVYVFESVTPPGSQKFPNICLSDIFWVSLSKSKCGHMDYMWILYTYNRYIYIYTRIIYGLLWIVWVVHGSSMNTVYDTMDGRNPAPGNRWFIHVYPIMYRLSTIPGGAGFLPSTVLYPSDCWLCQCNKWHSRWNVDDDSRSWFPTARSFGVSMSSACARQIKGGGPAHETIGKWSSNQEKIGFHGIHRWSIIAKLVNITPIWFMVYDT